MSFISGFLTMLLVAFLFTKIKGFIFKKVKVDLAKGYLAMKKESLNMAKETLPAQIKALNLTEGLNASIGKSYKKGKEPFSWIKFKKIFDLGDGVEWIKSIKEMLDLRKLTIYCIILASIFAYGYFKGRGNTPVQILDYATEFRLNMNGEYLHKLAFSNDLYLKDSKTDKIIKPFYAKDYPLIAKKLKPIGFILEPIFVAGVGAGNTKSGFEAGAGVSFIRYWRYKLDAFLTNKGIYLGTHYQITSNSGLGLGVGKGFDASNRIILYYKFKF